MKKHRNQSFIEAFGNRVKEMRKENGLTQEAISVACRVESCDKLGGLSVLR